jgi:apolipoprotein D and lipocalin family protein
MVRRKPAGQSRRQRVARERKTCSPAGRRSRPRRAWKYHPRGFVRDESNAVSDIQFIWPIKADYRVAHLAPDRSATVIGRRRRDYVWIMARTPAIPSAEYERLTALVESFGYDAAALKPVPQRW